MEAREGERLVTLTGVPPVGNKVKFVSLTPAQVSHFHTRIVRGTSRDIVVYMVLLNVARILQKQKFQFTPRWRDWLKFDNHVIRRALQRLDKGGLIRADFHRGKSATITVLERTAPDHE